MHLIFRWHLCGKRPRLLPRYRLISRPLPSNNRSVHRPTQVIQDTHEMTKADIDEIVLVGGSTRIPRVRQMLTGFFGRRNLIVPSEVDEGVASGAAIQAEIRAGLNRSEILNSMLLLDVIPFGFCCKIGDGDMVTILARNVTFPAKKSQQLPFTLDNNQYGGVRIYVYEATGPLDVDYNLLSDELSLDIPASMSNGLIEVTFDVDGNDNLGVHAVEMSTGTENRIYIRY